MNSGKQIYFCTASLRDQVHAQALGFTRILYLYAFAESDEEAQDLVAYHLAEKDVVVVRVEVKVASEQNPQRYTFLHQIINLPQAVLDEEYERRDYPDSFRDPARLLDLGKLRGKYGNLDFLRAA